MSNRTRVNAHIVRSRGEPDADALYVLAEAQAGYFTSAQAATAGYSHSLLSHHARSGTVERIDRGLYRLRRFPEAPHADLVVAWLRAGNSAAISHQSALVLHGISDVLPREVHATVPRTASRRRRGARLHTSALPREDVTTIDGIRVTSVERTIADVARAGLSEQLVLQAIEEALDRGLTTRDRLTAMAARRGGRARHLIERALAGTGWRA